MLVAATWAAGGSRGSFWLVGASAGAAGGNEPTPSTPDAAASGVRAAQTWTQRRTGPDTGTASTDANLGRGVADAEAPDGEGGSSVEAAGDADMCRDTPDTSGAPVPVEYRSRSPAMRTGPEARLRVARASCWCAPQCA